MGDSAAAVTWLFVPGDRPDRFEKARTTGSDEVICDLEDAVGVASKPAACAAVAAWLSSGGEAWVRINAYGTPWHEDDLTALVNSRGLRGIVLPKCEDPAVLTSVAEQLQPRFGVLGLVETARGVDQLHQLATCDGLARLAFGSIDFALDLGCAGDAPPLDAARASIVIQSRAAGLPAPVDGVTADVNDPVKIGAAARRSRQAGFGGKLCIHPAQVPAVATAFLPDEDELREAERILQAAAESPSGAVAVNGVMVDTPVVERARRLLGSVQPGR